MTCLIPSGLDVNDDRLALLPPFAVVSLPGTYWCIGGGTNTVKIDEFNIETVKRMVEFLYTKAC